jgi:hypothetical protein
MSLQKNPLEAILELTIGDPPSSNPAKVGEHEEVAVRGADAILDV